MDYTEGVTVLFDPARTSYEDCLDWFFRQHNPYRAGGQRGQYAWGVWWHNDEQKVAVERHVAELERDGDGGKVTSICAPLTDVYRAEEYHQKFYAKQQGRNR
eukprot:TRINITY_DN43695_c0_g1_i1.p3 TRINITY_DN43695_c0_g1~~TRINITY_DN43695_c0_g1_i1.p3  ORF type:complete len:102 (+),score=24.38 TRINITY_DN43695_c0_g1_i1:299-604(+)